MPDAGASVTPSRAAGVGVRPGVHGERRGVGAAEDSTVRSVPASVPPPATGSAQGSDDVDREGTAGDAGRPHDHGTREQYVVATAKDMPRNAIHLRHAR